jgi:uncharacterized protein (DUF2141 family)
MSNNKTIEIMNNIITTIALVLLTSTSCIAQETATLKITVPNATSDTGKMMIGVYTQETFMKAAPVYAANVVIIDGVATAIFENVPTGDYAVNIFHDKNENGRMDFENGRPAEAYGLSNNSMSMGPPTWGDATFLLKENTELTIRL